jgi:hypothetical protein
LTTEGLTAEQDVNRSRGGRNSRDYSHSRDINSRKYNNSCRDANNSREHYNSWDPGKPTATITSPTSESVARAEDSNKANSNSRLASNLANQKASKILYL